MLIDSFMGLEGSLTWKSPILSKNISFLISLKSHKWHTNLSFCPFCRLSESQIPISTDSNSSIRSISITLISVRKVREIFCYKFHQAFLYHFVFTPLCFAFLMNLPFMYTIRVAELLVAGIVQICNGNADSELTGIICNWKSEKLRLFRTPKI